MTTSTEKKTTLEYPENDKQQHQQSTTIVTGLLRFFKVLPKMISDPEYHFPMKLKIMGVVGLVYTVMPIDLIPELFFGPLGLVDDFGVIVVLLRFLYEEVERYAKRRGL